MSESFNCFILYYIMKLSNTLICTEEEMINDIKKRLKSWQGYSNLSFKKYNKELQEEENLNWWVDADVVDDDTIVDIYNKIDNRWKKPNHLIKCLFHAKLYV